MWAGWFALTFWWGVGCATNDPSDAIVTRSDAARGQAAHVLDEVAPPCAAPREILIDDERKWMEPPLDEDGAICAQDAQRVTVLHRGVRSNVVPSRYEKHYQEHGWSVDVTTEAMTLTRDGRTVRVRWTNYTDGTRVELVLPPS